MLVRGPRLVAYHTGLCVDERTPRALGSFDEALPGSGYCKGTLYCSSSQEAAVGRSLVSRIRGEELLDAYEGT